MVTDLRRGATLIELIVVVVVCAVIISLVVPSLSGAFRSARDAKSLGNLRTHATIFSLYAGDHDDFAPFFADPRATHSVVRGGGIVWTFQFFESSEAWVVALVDQYYEIGLQGDDWSVFQYPSPDLAIYQYSPSFIARPEYWNEATRGLGQLGPNRLTNVSFPSAKSCYVEFESGRGFPVWGGKGLIDPARWGFGFVDGSARRPNPDDLLRPHPRGEGGIAGARFGVGVVGMHTVDGINGRDVKP